MPTRHKSRIIHVVVIIAAIIAGGLLAGYLHNRQMKIDASRVDISGAPIAGFHKFASDVEWMRFINYMGSLKTVDESNLEEVTRRLEKIISLDPNFEKAYQVGVMFLSVKSPQKAVDLLDRACKNDQLNQNWKIPFYAGFILTYHFKDDKPEERAKKAAKYFKMALERYGGTPESFLINCYLRAIAQSNKVYRTSPKRAMLEVLYDKWKKSRLTTIEEGGIGGSVGSGSTSLIPYFDSRILKACQKAKEELNEQTKAGKTGDPCLQSCPPFGTLHFLQTFIDKGIKQFQIGRAHV